MISSLKKICFQDQFWTPRIAKTRKYLKVKMQFWDRCQKIPLIPWACSYLGWGGGGFAASQRSHLLWFIFSMLQTYLFGSRKPKTKFVFTPNSIFYIVSHLSNHLDQASHLKFVKFVPPFSRIVLLKFCPKPFKKICFTAHLTTKINQKNCKKK